MNPLDLLKKTIRNEAVKVSGDFQDITHRGTTKRGKVEYGDFRKTSKSDLGDRDIQDEISFLNVEATYVAKGDKVTFDLVDYHIEYFSPVVKGIFNIFAIKKVRTGSMGWSNHLNTIQT